MTTSLANAVAKVLAGPAPVAVIDACSLIDLFRRDETRRQPRVPPGEVRAAVDLLQLAAVTPPLVYLFVPTFVPREFADNADREESTFRKWIEFHDQNHGWLVQVSSTIGMPLPAPTQVMPFDFPKQLRSLANDLLNHAIVLADDPDCLSRAMTRVINKVRPSHKNHIKDSVNLEQCLEMSRRLQAAGHQGSRLWISSNVNDFAEPQSSQLHQELQAEFAVAGLHYHVSFQAALGRLRSAGEV